MVVDASVWVSALVPQDVHHTRSREWLEERLREGVLLVAPVILLAEVAGAIARRTGDPSLGERATEMILSLPTLRLVPVDDRVGGEAARLAARLRLRGADALYVAVASLLGVPLITWDREQQERCQTVVRTSSPGRT
ncbi:MAG: type II toxin-antitoxin system VapC family toxin [Chloroflexi bacterium]|nr:type II toxin-antitoxin system VapC family toxin [Chloroflexota bacterium]